MEKVKKAERILIQVAMVLLLIVMVEVSSGKENEKDTSRTVSAKEVETTTTIETAITETVNVDKVAAEPTTEKDIVKLYDVPLEAELQHYIIKLCEKENIAPSLVFAIIERESNFDPLAEGDSGNSLGLMQIQPKWHQWRADELGCLDWYNPYDNATVGINILAELFEKYRDDVYMVLMEYNGGHSYADRMANKGIVSDYAIEVDERAEELEKMREEQK